MKTIIVIEPTVVTLPHIPKAISWLDHQPLLVCQRSNYPRSADEHFEGVETVEADTLNVQSVLDAVQHVGAAGVIATGDRFLRVACEVAAALGVPGPDPSLRLMTDKAEIAKAVPDYVPETVVFQLSHIPTEAILDLLERHGRVVCKPGRAAGGDGLTLFDQGATADDVRRALAGHAQRFSAVNWLAQQSIDGTLVSLEGFTNGDDFRPLGLSIRYRIGCTETRSYFPCRDGFGAAEERIRQIQRDLLRRVGFQHGYYHSEYIVDHDDRPWVTDPNLGRIGGAGILPQLCYSFGLSPARVLAHMIEISLFHATREDSDLFVNPPRPSKSVIYGLPEGGVFQDIIAPEPKRVTHTIIAKQGVPLAPPGHNNRSHVGFIAGLDDDVDSYAENVRILTDKGPVAPSY